MTENSSGNYIPGTALKVVTSRHERFDKLNRYVREYGGWLVSVPGAADVEMQCLPHSDLPELLGDAGYALKLEGETERILPGQVIEQFGYGPGGGLVLLPPGSTVKVVETRHHAGICKVLRYKFPL